MAHDEMPDDERREMFREAEEAARRAQLLTRQLLTFSRGGAPVKSVIDLGGLVRDAARFALRGTSSECRLDIRTNVWPVEADAGQIAQVIQNLVLNASEATLGGGAIDVVVENHAREAQVGDLAPGPYVRVRVLDHGVGIAAAVLPSIFDPFFSTKGRGSGLGLSVAHSIVLRHGGHIEVSSLPGKGTQFEVLLPAVPEADLQGPSPKPPPERIHARVLVMDDDDAVRGAAVRALQSAGCEVGVAADGAEAVGLYAEARAHQRPFDLVILDLTVPGGMGGVQALDRIRAEDPGVRAIASSGYSTDPVIAEYGEHGFVGAIAKPWSADELRAAATAAMKTQ